jgi:hypothetical protein
MIKATDILESLDLLKEPIGESLEGMCLYGTDASAVLKGNEIILRTLGRVWKVPVIMKNEEMITSVDGFIVPLYNQMANLMDELKKNPAGIAVKVLDQSILHADPGRDREQAVSNGLSTTPLDKRGKFFNLGEFPRFTEPDMPDGSGLPEYLRNKVKLGGEEGGGNPNIFYMHRDGHRGASDEGEDD